MRTDDEIMRLFELADPAIDDRVRSIDAAGYLASIQTRSNEMKLIETETASPRRPRYGRWAVAIAAAAAVLLIVAGVVLLSPDDSEPASPSPAPTTSSPTSVAPTGIDVIEEAVAAFYSGDGERAAQLFDLSDRTDDEIRAESAYQAAINGRLTVSCTEVAPGSFSCVTPYRNAMTDAAKVGGGDDVWPVTVENGVITKFEFTEHTGLLIDMATYLASEARFDGFEKCLYGPFVPSCAAIENENIEGWTAWRRDVQPADRVAATLESWYRGDCEAAVALSSGAGVCSETSVTGRATAYESILGAEVSVEHCDANRVGEDTKLTCEVRYSNAMSRAVGASPAVTTRDFLLQFGLMTTGPGGGPWYEVDYPEDTTLRDSFTAFAQQGELADGYSAAGCAETRSPECAQIILDNLDAWAAWYTSNR